MLCPKTLSGHTVIFADAAAHIPAFPFEFGAGVLGVFAFPQVPFTHIKPHHGDFQQAQHIEELRGINPEVAGTRAALGGESIPF